MTGFRIRWIGTAKLAAVAVAALLTLQALPGLLKPPEPPPLGADVGLPQVIPAPEPTPPESRFETDARRPKGTTRSATSPKRRRTGFAVADVITSKSPGRPAGGRQDQRSQSFPPVDLPPPPAPAPEPAMYAVPPAPVAPAPVSDGSEEFAPR